jgi:hypothetical protein
MHIALSIHGLLFDPLDFLMKTTDFPKEYTIWEQDEIMKDGGPGVTLIFDTSKELSFLPFALGRFLLKNNKLLQQCVNVQKELNIIIDTEVLQNIPGNVIFDYKLSPKLMRLLAESNIQISIGKTLVI